MSDNKEPETTTVEIAEEGSVLHKSELFDVRITAKRKLAGLTRDRYIVAATVLDSDPTLQKNLMIDIPQDVWESLEVGEKVLARLYYHESLNKWLTRPPSIIT